MKKFLYRILIFCIPIIIAWLGLELLYRCVPNNYSYKNKTVKENYNAQVLILGNSHSFYGLNPGEFSLPAYNLSNISQSIYFDELLFNKHIEKFKKLKFVILTVDYFTLGMEDDSAEDKWRKYFYNAQMDLKVPSVSCFNPRAYSLALVPRFSLTMHAVKQYLNKGTLAECNEKGWEQYYGININNNAETGKEIVDKHEYGTLDFSGNVGRINNIIGECREKNIKVVLVTMPVTSYYADNVNKQKLGKIIAQCNSFNKKDGVYYVNLFQDKRFNNADFYDVDHLNTKGAQKCTEILNDYISEVD
ncbi:D-alanyl-lipoteichoic acid biosynthesis protein DltD [Flavobacterium sp. MK4S-17]|uniref:D-alanyl-lipoteichoic acid biosynthesis protein DltD n=1 Tax=Flavobacterium sp. MK4S-17 TaxID=2543737 RepID=UPI00135C450E|nr:D-alanyl-lipoteichoic acid biosynthesis protein DltD [Flavobacterium sp. MK4S-17]